MGTHSEDMSSNSSAVVVDEGELPAADVATTPMPTPNETALSEGDVSEGALQPHVLLSSTGGWHQGGDKMWGSGAGLESINSGNVGYYDQGVQQSDDRGQHPHCQCYRMASILRRKWHHCGVGLRMQHRASDQGGLQPQVPLSSVRARRA